MAEIRPFRGVRFSPEQAGPLPELVTAPFDVISPREQETFYARHPNNAIRVELAREHPTDTPGDNRYTRSAAQFAAWLAGGVLRADDAPSLYVYDETFHAGGETRTRRGFFTAVRLEEWENRVVLPHEQILPKKKTDRLNLLRACHANFSPVFSLYDDPTGRVADILGETTARRRPVADFALPEGSVPAAALRHRLWVVDDPVAIRAVRAAFAGKQLFIADGHHRYQTALEYREEARAAGASIGSPADYLLMLLSEIGDPGLTVLPTHRMVHGVEDLDRERVLGRLAEVFVVEEVDASELERHPRELAAMLLAAAERSAGGHAFIVSGLRPGLAHVLRLRGLAAVQALLPREYGAAWRGLDVAVLHAAIFDNLLGIGAAELASERFVSYTQDSTEALRAVRAGEQQLAFLLNPTRVTQIRDVALAGDRMPQKSTYFYPKSLTGLVIYSHEHAFEPV